MSTELTFALGLLFCHGLGFIATFTLIISRDENIALQTMLKALQLRLEPGSIILFVNFIQMLGASMTSQQMGTLTEEQIRTKAHKIWLTRQENGEPGDADTDWQEAVKALLIDLNQQNTSSGSLVKKYWYVSGIIILLFCALVAFVIT
ncbi:MAG: hypothetical protein AAGB01_01025 [Cyanobacteria bacterium P01_F01_bin.42]